MMRSVVCVSLVAVSCVLAVSVLMAGQMGSDLSSTPLTPSSLMVSMVGALMSMWESFMSEESVSVSENEDTVVLSFSGGGARSAAATNTLLELVEPETDVWPKVGVIAGLSGGCWGINLFCGHDKGAVMSDIKAFAAKKGAWAPMTGFSRLQSLAALYESSKGHALDPLFPMYPGAGKKLYDAIESLLSPGNRNRREIYEKWHAAIDTEVVLGMPAKTLAWQLVAKGCKVKRRVSPQCLVGYKSASLTVRQAMFTEEQFIVSQGPTRTSKALPRQLTVEAGQKSMLTATHVMALSSSAWTFITGALDVKFDSDTTAHQLFDQGIKCNLPLTGDWHNKKVIVLFDNSDNANKGLWAELDRCIDYWRKVHNAVVRKKSRLQLEIPSEDETKTSSSSSSSSSSSTSSTATDDNTGFLQVGDPLQDQSHTNPKAGRNMRHGSSKATVADSNKATVEAVSKTEKAEATLTSGTTAQTKAAVDSLITPLTVKGWDDVVILHVPLVGMTGSTLDRTFSASHPTFQSGAMSFFPANYPASKLDSFDLYKAYLNAFLVPLLRKSPSELATLVNGG